MGFLEHNNNSSDLDVASRRVIAAGWRVVIPSKNRNTTRNLPASSLTLLESNTPPLLQNRGHDLDIPGLVTHTRQEHRNHTVLTIR